jgi:uncharacterized protein YcgI (DUF1989 family)
MMEAVQTSETSVNSQQSTLRYNPEDSHLHSHRHENLKSYLMTYFLRQAQIRHCCNLQNAREQTEIEKRL